MADASAGEPLAYRHGVVLYSAQVTKGTPVTPATSCGNARVGWTQHSGNASFRGPGSASRTAVKGGGIYTDWNIRYEALQTGAKALIQKAARAAGVLPLLTLGFGYQDDVAIPNRSADQIQDCKIGSLRMGLDASGGHGPLSAEISGVGGLITVLTTLAPATLVTTPWMTYEGVFTRAAAAYQLRSWDMELNHNLSRDHVIPGATPASFQRGFSYLTEHAEAITGSISRYAAPGVAIQGNTVSTFAMQLVLTNLVDAAALTLAFTSVDFDEMQTSEDENGIFYSWNYEATGLTIS